MNEELQKITVQVVAINECEYSEILFCMSNDDLAQITH